VSLRATSLALLALACASCQTQRWTYSSEPPTHRAPLIARSVSVPWAVDHRDGENSNRQLLCVIPFVLWGTVSNARPETTADHMTSREWSFHPGEDIARAVAAELQASGLFREACFTSGLADSELVLKITVLSTLQEGKVLSYGLSLYGPLLWLIGFPAGTVSNELALDFDLQDAASGRSLWGLRCQRTVDHGAFWIYAPPSDFEYAALLKDMLLHDVLPALEALPAQEKLRAPR
jgi:hypothetical protein